MDDLLDNFSGQTLESPAKSQDVFSDARLTQLEHSMPVRLTATPTQSDLESAIEENYKYHFLENSPPGSNHAIPISPAAAKDPVLVDEADYNADIDDIDDDEDFVPEAEEATDEVDYVRVTEGTEGQSYSESDEFAQYLCRLRRQDTERDELLIVRNVHRPPYLLYLGAC